MRICQVSYCENIHQAKGYCTKHFAQIRKHGCIKETSYRKPIKLVCRNCKKKMYVGVDFLHSRLFSELYQHNYKKRLGKHWILCSICTQKKIVPAT